MGKGPHWDNDEIAILKYLHGQGKTPLEISKVLSRRTEHSIDVYLERHFPKPKHVITIAKPVVNAPSQPPKPDNFPDVGEILVKSNMALARIEIVLKDSLEAQRKTLELFERLENAKKPDTSH